MFPRQLKPRRAILSLVIVLIVAFSLVLPALAVNQVDLLALAGTSCTPGLFVTARVYVEVDDGEYLVVRHLINPTRNTATASTSVWTDDDEGAGDGVFDLLATVPPNTLPGDTLDLQVSLTNIDGGTISFDQAIFVCDVGTLDLGGGLVPGLPAIPGDGTIDVSPVSPAPPIVSEEVLGPACASFAVVNPGTEVVLLRDYPDCNPLLPDIAAACWVAEGQWALLDTSIVDIVPDGTGVAFTTSTPGTCGLFAAPPDTVYQVPQLPAGVPSAIGPACATFPVSNGNSEVAVLADFPDCASYGADLVVACQDFAGEWMQQDTLAVNVIPGGTGLAFDAIGYTTCGLFPIAPVAPPTPQICGTFDAMWGPNSLAYADFPDCAPYTSSLSVVCLNAEGNWIGDTVTDVASYPDGSGMSFSVHQHGLCGLRY